MKQRLGPMRVLSMTTLMLVFIVVDFNGPLASVASASTTCPFPEYAGWQDIHQYSDRYTGITGDINYSKDDILVSNTSTDHGLVWLGNIVPDGNAPWPNQDWLQAGYVVGELDQTPGTSTAEVYAEAGWPTEPKDPYTGQQIPYAWLYSTSQEPWGNNTFTTAYSNKVVTYKGNPYGIYDAFDNGVLIGTSYLIWPTVTTISATVEGFQGAGGSYCPEFTQMLVGTNGYTSDPGYNSSTILQYQEDYNGPWNYWNKTNDPSGTSTIISGYASYSLNPDYQSFEAWNAVGGG